MSDTSPQFFVGIGCKEGNPAAGRVRGSLCNRLLVGCRRGEPRIVHVNGGGGSFRAILTWGSAAFGYISTPEGDVLLETSGGVALLEEVKRPSRRIQNFGDDALPAPPPDAPDGVITPDLPSRLGGRASLTRSDIVIYIVSLAARLLPELRRVPALRKTHRGYTCIWLHYLPTSVPEIWGSSTLR